MATDRCEQQFTPDLSLLAKGRYKEFFYKGLDERAVAWLKTPVRKPQRVMQPAEHKSWEASAPQDWRLEAACKDTDPEVFFPESLAEYQLPDAPWRKLCPQCPVKDLCLKSATEPDDKVYGVFGGIYFNSRGEMRNEHSRLAGRNPKYPDSKDATNAERCKAYRKRKKEEIARKSQLD
jgi:WhiB family redox-sensing transcriptional regulator